MTKDWTLDQYAQLPEKEAVRAYFDRENVPVFRWLRVIALLMAAVTTLVSLHEGAGLGTLVGIIDLAIVLVYFLGPGWQWFEARFRTLLITFIVAQYLVLLLAATNLEVVLAPSSILFPLLFLFLRFSVAEYMGLGLLFMGGSASAILRFGLGNEDAGIISVPIVINAILVAAGIALTKRKQAAFLREWRTQVTKERERARMREELADARKIQLSMLPEGPPQLDWLDVTSLAMPATEVGGDFFDYIELADNKIAIVIGDVAGHGVASGLVLAGIKSGLHLLRDELHQPVQAVERLNVLVRDWLRWRMLVSMLIAVVDPVGRRIRVVSAGHPPLLHFSKADGRVTAVGHGALPLGTKLPPKFRTDEVSLAPGDCFLLYTDGVTELINQREEAYGEERLIKAFERGCRETKSRSIREAILDDLAHFKQDSPQLDDISLVVGRIVRSFA